MAIQDPHVTLKRIAELRNGGAKPTKDQSAKLERLLAEAQDLLAWHDQLTGIRVNIPEVLMSEDQSREMEWTLDRLIADARQTLPDQRGRLIACLEVMAMLRTKQERVGDAERSLVEALDQAREDLDNATRFRSLVKRFKKLTAMSGPKTKEGKAWLESYESAPWKLDLQSDAMFECLAYLRRLDGAKQQWALEHGKAADDVLYAYQLVGFSVPACPGGGEYHIGKVKDTPVCSVHGSIADIEKRRAKQ